MSLYKKDDWSRRFPCDDEVENDVTPYNYFRSPWRRDYARIIHSASFRRLQSKTQLFSGFESDFFRNRLTHSLEVAQIAKSIASYINYNNDYFKDPSNSINLDLVEISSLAHDLGHAPFGHNGEEALDRCMINQGGYEGNAQTLRILSTLEKKTKLFDDLSGIENKKDGRLGLNLTYRTLASVLKYDNIIPRERRKNDKLKKGYYYFNNELVQDIKYNVCGDKNYKGFKTIECSIMDVADDIAYSTYDLEDAFKAGFLTPFDILSADDSIVEKITTDINKKNIFKTRYKKSDVRSILYYIFGEFIYKEYVNNLEDLEKEVRFKSIFEFAERTTNIYDASKTLAQNGYLRTDFTSRLVNYFVTSVVVEINEDCPALSQVKYDAEIRVIVEVLKRFVYISLINSAILKIVKYRGYRIIMEIFEAIKNTRAEREEDLLPRDFRELYKKVDSEYKDRVICDYISGMTDRYAIEYYSRLFGENPQTIYKPL
jgi:dGTPase